MKLYAALLEPYLIIGFVWATIIAPIVHWFAYRQTHFERMRNEMSQAPDYPGDDWFMVLYVLASFAHGLYWPVSITRFIWLRIKEIKEARKA